MTNIDLKNLEEKLDEVIALLRILASKEVDERRRIVLSTTKKQQIYELCDGSNEMNEVARKAEVSGEYVRLTVKDLEDNGFVKVISEGAKRYPKRII